MTWTVDDCPRDAGICTPEGVSFPSILGTLLLASSPRCDTLVIRHHVTLSGWIGLFGIGSKVLHTQD